MMKIYNVHLAIVIFVFWQYKKAEKVFYFWRWDWQFLLFMSWTVWYCQIWNRLIIFFGKNIDLIDFFSFSQPLPPIFLFSILFLLLWFSLYLYFIHNISKWYPSTKKKWEKSIPAPDFFFSSGSGSWFFFPSGSGSWYFFPAAPAPAPRGQKHPAPAPWQNILFFAN